MTPAEYIRKIPAKIRFAVGGVLVAAVIVVQCLEFFDVSISEGVWKTLAFLGGYFGVQSLPNIDLKGDTDAAVPENGVAADVDAAELE